MKKTISAILLVATLLSTVIASCFAASDKALVVNAAEQNVYKLEVSAPENVVAGEVIDVVITAKDFVKELVGVGFVFDYDETKVEALITEAGSAMDDFMTTVPMYTMVFNGAESKARRYEQMCRHFDEGYYTCYIVDLLSYPLAKEGETYDGLKNDGDLVVTIQFKVKDTVSAGDEISFSVSNVSGTTITELVSIYGNGSEAKSLVVDEIIEESSEESSAEEPSVEESSAEEPSAEEPSAEEPSVEESSAEEPSVEESSEVSVDNPYNLEISVPETAVEGDIIDVVITNKNFIKELDAISFTLDYDETKVEALITTPGNKMDVFMTKTPMYTIVFNGAEGLATRYEQVCSHNSENGYYVCRFIDLISYPNAKEGETYKGLINDGDIVITIQFKVKDTVSAGDKIAFSVSNVSGTVRTDLVSVSGTGSEAFVIAEEKAEESSEVSVEESSEVSVEESSEISVEESSEISEEESSEPAKEGIVLDEDGEIRYYVNGVATYAGLVQDSEGNYYYISGSTLAAIKNTTKYITFTNGLLPAGNYTFGEDGKLILKQGIVLDNDGYIRYYVDGIATAPGLVQDADGNYYYISGNGCVAVKNRTYYVSESKANGLLPAGNYEFGADGKMIKKQGVVHDSDGEIRYYVDGVPAYAGLVQDQYGNYYYISGSTLAAVKNTTRYVSMTNGLLPSGEYTFGEDGRLVKQGIVLDNDGYIRYYVDGVSTVPGLVQDNKGNYYYISGNGGVAITNQSYYVSETKANGLVPAGTYKFASDGKMILKEGVTLDSDGYIRYYVDGAPTAAGLVKDADGNYYYISGNGCVAVTNRTYYVAEEKTNGLLPAGNYTFGADGKMIVE